MFQFVQCTLDDNLKNEFCILSLSHSYTYNFGQYWFYLRFEFECNTVIMLICLVMCLTFSTKPLTLGIETVDKGLNFFKSDFFLFDV